LSEGDITKLIRGDKEALAKQAEKGGNIKPTAGSQLPPGMLSFDIKSGDFLPAPDATKEQQAYARKLIDDHQKALTAAIPDNTATLATSPDLAKDELDALAAEFAKSQEAEDAFKEYLEGLQTKAEFESEEAADQARQESWERYIRGKQSAYAAGQSAKNPANAAKAKANPKDAEPKTEGEAEQAQQEKPWWQSSGSGPRFMFGGQGAGGDVQRSVGGIAASGEAAIESQRELLKRKQARAGAKAPPPPTPPAK
jgi:hypothetical protein